MPGRLKSYGLSNELLARRSESCRRPISSACEDGEHSKLVLFVAQIVRDGVSGDRVISLLRRRAPGVI